MLPAMQDFKGQRTGPKPLEQISRNGSLAGLMQAAARLDKMTQRVRYFLPQHLRECVSVAGFERGLLTLLLNDRAYLIETRFMTPELMQKLARDFDGLKNIQWRVARTRRPPKRVPNQIAKTTIHDLDEWLAQADQRGQKND